MSTTCDAFTAEVEVNGRVHWETRRIPAQMLARRGAAPAAPGAGAGGQSRRVGKDATIQVEAVRYSAPHTLVDQSVRIRFHGRELIVTAMVDRQPVEVARHQRSTPGNPSIDDAYYPQGSRGERTPRPTRPAGAEFPAIGPGAALWLQEAGESGVRHARSKMADAVTLAKLHGSAVDRALGTGHPAPPRPSTGCRTTRTSSTASPKPPPDAASLP